MSRTFSPLKVSTASADQKKNQPQSRGVLWFDQQVVIRRPSLMQPAWPHAQILLWWIPPCSCRSISVFVTLCTWKWIPQKEQLFFSYRSGDKASSSAVCICCVVRLHLRLLVSHLTPWVFVIYLSVFSSALLLRKNDEASSSYNHCSDTESRVRRRPAVCAKRTRLSIIFSTCVTTLKEAHTSHISPPPRSKPGADAQHWTPTSMAINRPFCPLSTQKRRLHLTPRLSRAVCLICSRQPLWYARGAALTASLKRRGRQRWNASLMTFFSGGGAVKGERTNSLPVASPSTRLNLPSKDSSRWWRNQNASRVPEIWWRLRSSTQTGADEMWESDLRMWHRHGGWVSAGRHPRISCEFILAFKTIKCSFTPSAPAADTGSVSVHQDLALLRSHLWRSLSSRAEPAHGGKSAKSH